jgi:hypothetical protein
MEGTEAVGAAQHLFFVVVFSSVSVLNVSCLSTTGVVGALARFTCLDNFFYVSDVHRLVETLLDSLC